MKINKGYKVFEMDMRNGKLYPLFIGKKKETIIGEWMPAEIIEYHPNFASRPGWHLNSEVPSAVHLMGSDGTYKSQRGKNFKRIWCEISYVADVDYTTEVQKLPKRCFTDKLPENGYYKFKESGNRLWIIADRIKITKVLTEDERQKILKEMNYDEKQAFEPYRASFEKRKRNAGKI